MKFRSIILVILCTLLLSCHTIKVVQPTPSVIVIKSKNQPLKHLKSWQYKDIIDDTIPGISLYKAYKELLKNKIGDTVIVAILDSGFDIDHEDLKEHIWINIAEIPNNNIDDDKNGYKDDVHGWNFLGNSTGENLIYANWEFVRILKKYNPYFKNRDSTRLDENDRELFAKYQRANQKYKVSLAELEEDKKYIEKFVNDQKAAKEVLQQYFPNNDYTVEDIYKIDPKGDDALKQRLINRVHSLYYNLDDQWVQEFIRQLGIKSSYKLNITYNDREKIGDDPEKIDHKNYGNNDFRGDLKFESHGTSVAGIIAANRNNNLGTKGILDKVKIMPIRVVPRGDEYDKDVALAILYAVDNGAKVINMSFGKEFSMNPEFVLEAIRYAAKRQVLIVSAAGNEALNIDKNNYYPSDMILHSNAEILNNFMKVGATTHHLDSAIYTDFSNYGKVNVDLFAPGDEIYTTFPNNEYKLEGGTSFASPIVAGTAALIWSYYPDLSASEVKGILMQSGTSYNIEIEIKQDDGTKTTVPFSELSKSGKVVNAYNALIMAESLAKK